MRPSREKILRYFPTEKHKRFYFPVRPLVTTTIAALLLTMVIIHALPVLWAVVLMAAFAFDDLPLTPLIKLVRAINNLAHGRKEAKAIVMITTVSLCLIAGGLLATFLLTGIPAFMIGIASFVLGTGCSPTYILMGCILGFTASQFSGKVTPYLGIALGFIAGFVIGFFFPPFAIPLALDAIVISSLACAFVGAVLAKECMRIFYKWHYGHSNADGYMMNRTPEAQENFITQQANAFGVTKEAFTTLTEYCKTRIKSLKEHASTYDKVSLTRHYQTNAYKDIYHSLMNPELTAEDVQNTKKLLQKTKESASCQHQKQLLPSMFTGRRDWDFSRRLAFHQQNIQAGGGGIDDAVLKPFIGPVDASPSSTPVNI